MRTWGYWGTFSWAFLAFVLGQVAAVTALIVWRHDTLETLVATPFDGVFVTLVLLIANPITIGVIAFAVWLKRASLFDYLALTWPQSRTLALGLLAVLVFIAAGDAILFLAGRPMVTNFQGESYASAQAQGWLAPYLFATIILAPVSEEIIFRGFLFRGWARSERSLWPAIVVISACWAVLHVQYDWSGLFQIFLLGLFLGATRWLTGSTLLTVLMHGVFNLEATVETIVSLRFFS